MAACTIVANNYLGAARVLAASYRRHHPGARIFVCIVDRPAAEVRYDALPFEVIFADELAVPGFANMAFRYGVVELATAVKPFLFAHLRDVHGLPAAFYFDPDIWVLDRLGDLEADLARADAVLTPHITRPLDDSFYPGERVIRQCGVYNLGFLGLRLGERTRDFLAWWQERLLRFCVVAPAEGLFVDQSWMDFAPAFLDRVVVARSPAFNVAYWNLGHRRLRPEGDAWWVDDRPVGFVHFSGFDARRPDEASRHQDRLRLSERPELRPLFAGYRRELLAAGHESYARLPYGHAAFRGTSIAVPAIARRLLQRVDPYGLRWPDPFAVATRDSFLEWLVEPIHGADGQLNRLVLSLWEERGDLVAAFPDVLGADLPRYARWLSERAGAEAGLEPFFHRATGAVPAPRRRSSGVAAFGYHLQPYAAAVVDHGRTLLEEIDLGDAASLGPWLNDPIPGTARRRPLLTRLALLVYRSRPDVQARYPDPLGRDQADLAYWLVRCGAEEYGLDPALVRPVARSLTWRSRGGIALHRLKKRRGQSAEPAPARRAEAPEPPAADASLVRPPPPREGDSSPRGVNVVGYLEPLSGVGEAARGNLAALAAAGIPCARLPVGGMGDQRDQRDPRQGVPFPVTLVHANADETANVLRRLPVAALAGGYRVAVWFWELSHFPLTFADRFAHLDEVWAPSRFCQEAFAPLSPIPVRWVPPCVPEPAAIDRRPRRAGRDADRFTFFFSFDVGSIVARKNPCGLIEAFREVDRRLPRRTALELKIVNAASDPALVGELQARAEGLPVAISSRHLDRRGMLERIAACDAVVSLHRSEGLGLLLIEALLLGRPVVATAYGGVTDFLDDDTGFPVAHRLVTLHQDFPPYPRGAVWAEPSLDAAVEAMVRVVVDVEEREKRVRAGRRRAVELYGLVAAAERLEAELERIAELRRSRRRVTPLAAAPAMQTVGGS